ncbi:MAG: hypothetical protein PHE99_02770 [Bacteroidales bacterium]|nr:hypothetical protein [Bacteroidales bacterium]MDD4656641.1 hypothetical protein [Bacteroidales bacterium]
MKVKRDGGGIKKSRETGNTQEKSGDYFIILVEKRDRVVERELNIKHNPQSIESCIRDAINGIDINSLALGEVKRLVFGLFYSSR